jgi:hypothetical protein
MTEKEEDPVDLLYEAARLCGFDRRAGWPERFEVHHLVLLLAGGRLGRKPDEWKLANAQVNDGIEAGTLKTEDVDQGFEEVECDADALPEHERFKKAVFPKIDHFNRQRFVYYERRKKKPKRYVTREACCDWLHAIKKAPPRLVRAWLGDAWQEEAPKVGAGDTAPIERRTRAALIRDLQAEWHTIGRDLQDASRNGLAAARLAARRGWDKGRALEWAKEHGKLIEKTAASWYSPPAILPAKAKRGSK